MRKKIIGAIVFIMLLLPVLSTTGAYNTNIENEKTNSSTLEDDICMVIYKAPLGFGVDLYIRNKGVTTLNDVEWSLRSKPSITATGIFMTEKLIEGTIGEIAPDETVKIKFRPFGQGPKSPFGIGNLYMNASVEVDGMSVRTQQRAMIIGFFLVMYRDTYMDIKPPEVYERWQNEEFDLIIDVVGLDIYNLGHLPGAVNYVWADGTLESKIPDLDSNATYLVYCHTDPPSTASAQLLVNSGFENVYRLEGNFAAWKDAGYPIET